MNEQKTYEQGINDFVECINILYLMNCEEKEYVFKDKYRVGITGLLKQMSPLEFINSIKAYKEESLKPKLGDVVEIEYADGEKQNGIFLYETSQEYDVLLPNTECSLQILYKEIVKSITKTGEHIDIQGMLDKLA